MRNEPRILHKMNETATVIEIKLTTEILQIANIKMNIENWYY